ncbi:MAG: TetR/AcrR family transcriptional regulator [Thermoleophilia bacterium]
MPKVVDHDARREGIADALMALLERDGADHVALRAVAAESGWSTGVLAHYFADKDALLTYAFELVATRAAQRGARRAAAAPDARGAARALLAECLPLDARRRREARLWFAYLERARTVPAMAAVARRRYDDWTGSVAGALEGAGLGAGEAAEAARELVALVDGLTVQALTDPRRLPRPALERGLDTALGRVLGSRHGG